MYKRQSLAGALRGWLEKQDKNAANALFGSQEKSGQLIVSDMEIKEKAAKSSEDTTIQLRPRLRINGKMGAAADSGKFDVAHIARNTVMQFTLTLSLIHIFVVAADFTKIFFQLTKFVKTNPQDGETYAACAGVAMVLSLIPI